MSSRYTESPDQLVTNPFGIEQKLKMFCNSCGDKDGRIIISKGFPRC